MNTQIDTLNKEIEQRIVRKQALEALGLRKSIKGGIINAN